MKFLSRSCYAFALAGAVLGVLYAQRPFRQYPSVEGYETMPLPADWERPAEWTFARLMYPPGPLDGYYPRFQGDWRKGLSLWTQDYPKADRALSAAVGRLTRIDARSVEQPVNLDDGDEVYNWPWLYAVQVGEWGLTEPQCKKLRDYLLRGGFFMADDFHGSEEQAYFEKTMKMVFPDRPIVDIPDDDPIFHTVFDLDDRYQVPGAEHLATGYKKTAASHAGAASMTTKATSWSPSPRTPTSATHGSGSTAHATLSASPTSASASASTTSSTP